MPDDLPPPPPPPPPPDLSAVWVNERAHRQAWSRLVAARLYQLRWRLQQTYGDAFSARSVAKALGRSPTWLSNIENGHRRVDVATLRVLAMTYGADPRDVMAEPTVSHEQSSYDAQVETARAGAKKNAEFDMADETHRRRRRR